MFKVCLWFFLKVMCIVFSAGYGTVCGVHCLGPSAQSQGVHAAPAWAACLRRVLGQSVMI